MTCLCGHVVCKCGDICLCCPYVCRCSQCYKLRLSHRAHCHLCGGRGACPLNPRSNLHRTDPHQSSRPLGRPILGRYVPEAAQGSSTVSRRCIPEPSQSPPRESPTFDDSLQFQMDDINPPPPPEVSTNASTGAKSKVFHRGSHFSSNKSVSIAPFERREPPKRVRRFNQHRADADRLKCPKSTKCKIPLSLLKTGGVTGSKLKESLESEGPINTQNVAGCSHPNPDKSISEIEESRVTGESPLRTLPVTDFNRTELLEREIQSTSQGVPGYSHLNPNANISKLEEYKLTEISSEHKLDATDLKWTESPESEMMTTKDIAGCSYDYKCVSKQEESQTTYNAWYELSPSEDEYASESLPSDWFSDDSPPCSFSVCLRSPTPPYPLSTSAPSRYELPQLTELKSSEQKTSTVLGTTEQSPTSYSSKFEEALRIVQSHPIDKSRTSSESSSSIEILPENMPNGARYDSIHGQPGIPSLSVASSQLNNSVMKADSSKPGTSRQHSNSHKLPSSKVSKSARRRSSESDSSTETVSREQANDNSEDEAPTNKSPKKT